MRLPRIRFALLATALACTGSLWGAGRWSRPFALMGQAQGLPDGGITCIAQDANGFLWMGTENGLLRYEGGQARRWTRQDGLPSDHVDRILTSPDGAIWISTPQGLARFHRGRCETYRLEGVDDPTGIEAMALDGAGQLWVATLRGLFVQGRDAVLHPRTLPLAGRVRTVASGLHGRMLVGTEQGLVALDPEGAADTWTSAQGVPAGGVELVGEDGAGRLWICTGRRLVAKEPGGPSFVNRSSELKALVTPYGAFTRDQDGSLWLPTQEGALHLQGIHGTLLGSASGLPMQWVRHVFRDREGGLWILGPTLARLLGNDQVWNHPLTDAPSGQVVWSMLRLPGGDLLVGTDDGVLRVGSHQAERIPGTEGHRIKGMAVDAADRLWMVGTRGPTLWLPRGGTRATVAPLGKGGTGVNSVMTDTRGQVWLGHATLGILRWDARQQALIQEVAPAGGPATALGAYQMAEDRSGRLWAATTLGLYLREGSGTWRLLTDRDGILPFGLYGLALRPDGSAWIFSREPMGLQRIQVEGAQVTSLERRQLGAGLHSDRIYAVAVDPQGRTWATTDRGFECLETGLHVGQREGAISEDCDLLALHVEREGVWVGTSAGLVRYTPGEPAAPLPAPVPHILQAAAGAQRLEAPEGDLGTVEASEANLAFRVAVPSYQHQGRLRIQVRLVGLESAWRDLDAPTTRYQALSRGSYRFEARAAQPDGPFGPVTGLSFRVLPPWWGTWWAWMLWGLAVLGVFRLVLRWRVANLARHQEALEALIGERTEELRRRNGELTEALGKVRQLSGLLPICASCKKIRDDKGYWNQLEQYISAHSDVGFSHGICPDCVESLFPGRSGRPGVGNGVKP